MRKYTDQHEWMELQNPDQVIVGITDYAQHQLGDVVYVTLPEVGKSVTKGQEVAVVESVKAASEVYSPISGTIIEVNEILTSQPDKVNTSAESEGWFFKIKPTQKEEMDKLMSQEDYLKFIHH